MPQGKNTAIQKHEKTHPLKSVSKAFKSRKYVVSKQTAKSCVLTLTDVLATATLY